MLVAQAPEPAGTGRGLGSTQPKQLHSTPRQRHRTRSLPVTQLSPRGLPTLCRDRPKPRSGAGVPVVWGEGAWGWGMGDMAWGGIVWHGDAWV